MKKVLIGILLLVLFSQCAFLGKRIFDDPPESFCTTVTTKIQHQNQYNKNDLFQFYHHDKAYVYPGENMYWAPVGEKFLLKYDTLVPDGGYNGYKSLQIWHPVFLPGEVTDYTVGTLTFVRNKHSYIGYIYTVGGKPYLRYQSLPLNDIGKDYPQLAKGARFLVEYLVDNPQRAIIYIDKPEKNGASFPVSPDIHVLRPAWYNTPVVLPDSVLTKSQLGW